MRRALVTLICLATGVVLAGCGSPTDPSTMAQAANTAAPQTRYATADLLADALRNTMAHKKTGRVTGTVSTTGGAPADFNCDFAVDPTGYGLDCGYALPGSTPSGPSSNVRLLAVHDDVYLQPATRTTDGRPWLQVDLSTKDNTVKQLALARTRARSAADVTSWLAGADLENIADDQVDGNPTTRYDLSVPLDSVPGKDSDPTTRAELQSLTAHDPATRAKLSIWLDPAGLPVRTRSTLPTAQLHQPDLADTVITSDFTTWGEDTAIAVPPPDQVSPYPAKK